jgi:hypothetical protein
MNTEQVMDIQQEDLQIKQNIEDSWIEDSLRKKKRIMTGCLLQVAR